VKWPRPSNLTEVRGFGALTSYIEGIILHYADIARPSHRTIKHSAAVDRKQPVAPRSGQLITYVPSLYVFNAAGLAKPHAVKQLAAELSSYGADVALITETHFKVRHTDSVIDIPDYTVFRRDRSGRKGGGVAVYVRSTIETTIWTSAENRFYEILWVRIGQNTFVAVLYHPPKPLYQPAALIDYIETCIEKLNQDYPAALIVLAGDTNQLSNEDMIESTGLTQIVNQPTRGANILDRVYVSNPQMYNIVRVVTSVVTSDHKAVVVCTDNNPVTRPTSMTRRTYRPITLNQHANFLKYVSTAHLYDTSSESDTQTQFDKFYSTTLSLLNQFYPEKTVAVRSRDPAYMTPDIKTKLRKKNHLMRAGRLDEAGVLAARIGNDITRQNKICLKHTSSRTNAKDIWTAVRQLTGRQRDVGSVDGVTAESLNTHYALISTDAHYTAPLAKITVTHSEHQLYISEWQVFRILDRLHPTATGPDQLPAWFLRLGAPVFSQPITHLINLSLASSTIPIQWKQASIRPVPKIVSPKTHSDFRPISITSVLTRIMERTVVSRFLYPAFITAPQTLSIEDQYAFRPTGSTTAALVHLFHTITHMLTTNPYVIVLCLDFSKAFDTVRHSTLLEKLAQLDMPDNVYNWMVDFFNGHSHRTKYEGQTSSLHKITASVIQGSSIGPASYVVNAADLKAITPGNEMDKFADDSYIIVPAVNSSSRLAEIKHAENWASVNN